MAGVCSKPGCPEYSSYLGRCRDHARQHNQHQHRTVPTKATRDHDERQRRAKAVATHRRKHGDWCPGDDAHDPHPCTDLTAHHVDAVASGGRPDGYLTVLCRSRNSAIGSRTQGHGVHHDHG